MGVGYFPKHSPRSCWPGGHLGLSGPSLRGYGQDCGPLNGVRGPDELGGVERGIAAAGKIRVTRGGSILVAISVMNGQ